MSETSAPTTPAKVTPPVAYRRLMAGAVVCMIMFGAVLVVPPVCLDAIGRELDINFEHRGLLISIRMVALIASLLVIGRIAERGGKRYYLFAGLTAIALAQALGARARTYEFLFGAMIVSGLGKGVVEALVNPLVAQLHPRHSARALNIVNGIFSVGLVFGALTTGALLQAGASWRLPFWLWVLPPLVAAVLFFTPRYPKDGSGGHPEEQPPAATKDLGPSPAAPGDKPRKPTTLRRFVRLPLFWVLLAAMVVGGGCEAGLTSWAPNFTSEVLGATALGGAWTTALYGAAMALGRLTSGLIVARLGTVRLMAASAVLCGAATLGLTFVHSLVTAYVLFALGGLFVACFWPTLLSVASDHISSGSTWLLSLMAAAGVSGCVLFPWAIGRLGDLFNLRIGMLVLPVSMVTLLVMLGLVAGLTRRKQENA